MATTFFFADNTVLVSFALVGRLPLLQAILNGRGTWCASVETECLKSARKTGIQSLESVRQVLGDPVFPTPAELSHTQMLRDSLAVPGDDEYKYLGEAESIAIIELRSHGSILVTDDNDADRLAQSRGITVVSTLRLMRIAFKKDLISDVELFEALKVLRQEGRDAPYVKDATDARAWVASCE